MQTSEVTQPSILEVLRQSPTVSVETAGAALGLGRASAYKAAKCGQLPSIRLGRRLVVPSGILLRMLGADLPPQLGDAG